MSKMQKKLVDCAHLFLGDGVSLSRFEEMRRENAKLRQEVAQLKKVIRHQAERENPNTENLGITRH